MTLIHEHQAELKVKRLIVQELESDIRFLESLIESHGVVPWGRDGFQPKDCYRTKDGRPASQTGSCPTGGAVPSPAKPSIPDAERFEHRRGFGPGDGGKGFPDGVEWR